MPAHLCTSPIPLEIPEEMEESPEGASLAVSGTRRRKRRRRRNRSDNHPRDAARSSSEERDTDWERESEAGLESPPTEQPVSHLQVRLETRAKLVSLRVAYSQYGMSFPAATYFAIGSSSGLNVFSTVC